MVPVEVVKNQIQYMKDHLDAISPLKSEEHLFFDWNETVEIPVSTGKAMEEYNGSGQQSSDDPATDDKETDV
jgi:hypothetical protein